LSQFSTNLIKSMSYMMVPEKWECAYSHYQ